MAKIAFVQLYQQPFFGMFYLCGAIKEYGHDYRVIVSTDPDEVGKEISQYQPDIIGFTMYSGYHVGCLNLIKKMKESIQLPILVGGPHPTYFPDIIHEDGVDIVCRGEAEMATVDILNRLDSGEDFSGIQNLIVKTPQGKIIKNNVRRLVECLDDLPMPDFSVYKDHPLIMNQLQPTISASRGCVYDCTYCYNDGFNKVYDGSARRVRLASPRRVIEEIKVGLKVMPNAKSVDFPGDHFGIKDDWLSELMILYKKEIGLPFNCLYRPEAITEKRAELLKSGGCDFVAFGIESGSERLRKEVLQRNYKNKTAIKAASILRKNGIRYRTYNIVGMPTETVDDLWKTVELNIKIRPELPWCSIYMPYPGTGLAKLCIDLGLLPKNFTVDMIPTNFHLGTILNISHDKLVLQIHHYFQSMILFPHLMPLWKFLIKMPANKLTELWFKMVFLYCRIKSDRPRHLIRYTIGMVKSRG